MSTPSTSLNLLAQYLKDKFYVRVPFSNPNIGVYYNSSIYEVLSVIPFEHRDAIAEVLPFSDYISLISEADHKIDYPADLSIGIIYVDSNSQSTSDAITTVRLPVLQVTDPTARSSLLTPVIRTVFVPNWVKFITSGPASASDTPAPTKDPTIAHALIEKAIQSYCSLNNLPRSEITSYSKFIDHIAPDIFSHKMTVAEEMQLRKEAELLDTKVACYPEVLLKAIVTLELVT